VHDLPGPARRGAARHQLMLAITASLNGAADLTALLLQLLELR